MWHSPASVQYFHAYDLMNLDRTRAVRSRIPSAHLVRFDLINALGFSSRNLGEHFAVASWLNRLTRSMWLAGWLAGWLIGGVQQSLGSQLGRATCNTKRLNLLSIVEKNTLVSAPHPICFLNTLIDFPGQSPRPFRGQPATHVPPDYHSWQRLGC